MTHLLVFGLVTGLLVFLAFFLMGKRKKKGALLGHTLPLEIISVLEKEVGFYKGLTPREKSLFSDRVGRFLFNHAITGIGVEVNHEITALVGASAIIPIFHFPKWVYPNLGDILIYPDAIESYEVYDQSANLSILGQVTESAFRTDVVKLSKRDLLSGFKTTSKHNVGVHEFTHLVDKADGVIDGVPRTLLSEELTKVWSDRIHTEITKIKELVTTDIDEYGATNEAEFFAVVSEYFFKRPKELESKHPKLYDLLEEIFNQPV